LRSIKHLQDAIAVLSAENVATYILRKKKGKQLTEQKDFLSVAENYRCFINLRIFTKEG